MIPDAFTELHRGEIVALTVRYRVPAINWSRSFAEGRGLISYGPYLIEEYRRAATYADRILKGEKPSELPVRTPVKFELKRFPPDLNRRDSQRVKDERIFVH